MRLYMTFLIVLILCVCGAGAADDAVTGRAVSLKMLQSALRAGNSRQAANLCGITRVSGYVVDGRSRDIILVGEVDPSLPSLHADDFAVALRNAWMLYAKVQGKTRYYSAPGCSIDPNPGMLRELEQVGDRLSRVSDPAGIERCLEEWREVGSRPQNVRVMGVPFDSRFARVMVDADFYMKRLVNGSVALEIEGFRSLSDLSADESREAMRSGKPSSSAQTLSRFWFHPAESTYTEEDGVVLLRSCRVALLTEEEMLTEQNRVAGKGRPNPLAKRFADSFTDSYPSIARERPIYTELEGLFRFAALARLMKDSRADSTAGLSLDYLLKSHRMKNVPVSRAVRGLTNVKRVSEEIEIEGGVAQFSMLFPSCGGVSMDVRPKRIGPTPRPASSQPTPAARSGKSTAPPRASSAKPPPSPAPAKKAVLDSRKSAGSLSWDFPVSAIR